MMQNRPISEAELDKMLAPFRPLICWKVGLVLGSMVYFELGDKVEAQLLDGTPVKIGSATITLWGDNWKVMTQDHEITNSSKIDREFAETVLAENFVGCEFLTMSCSRGELSYQVVFSKDLEVRGWCEEDREDQTNLTPLFLPDGTIISLTMDRGLFVSSSHDETRAQHWRSTNQK